MIKKLNNEIENLPIIVKIIACIIMTILITLMSFLFVGVSKVNALTTYTANDNYTMGTNGNSTLANDTWRTFTGTGTWTATNTNWYTAMNGMATAYLRINWTNTSINNANWLGNNIGIRVYLNNNYVSGTASSYTCVKETATSGYCDYAVQFSVNGQNTIIVQTYRKSSLTLTNPTFKWNAHIDLDTSSVVTPNTIQTQTQQIINNNDNNTDRMIDHMILFHEADEEEWEEEKGLLQSILSAIGGIFSSSIDDPSNTLNSFNNSIATNNTVSSLLLLPVRLYQNVLNNINGSCNSFTLGSLYNHNLTMTCIQPQSFLGSALYGVIDVIISGFFILHIRKKFVDIFNHLTSLRTGGNELE